MNEIHIPSTPSPVLFLFFLPFFSLSPLMGFLESVIGRIKNTYFPSFLHVFLGGLFLSFLSFFLFFFG